MVRSITECGGNNSRSSARVSSGAVAAGHTGQRLGELWADPGQAFDSEQRIEFERAHAPDERQIWVKGKADNCVNCRIWSASNQKRDFMTGTTRSSADLDPDAAAFWCAPGGAASAKWIL
jgi:hypothetical protein